MSDSPRRLWALPFLLLLVLPLPAAALDILYIVRHAEKVDDWPAAPDLDAFRPGEMAAFLSALRKKHAGDRAVLVVGHGNTIPELLQHLGAKPECFERLGISGKSGSPMTESYDGLWRVDLKKPGCDGIVRETQAK